MKHFERIENQIHYFEFLHFQSDDKPFKDLLSHICAISVVLVMKFMRHSQSNRCTHDK